MQVIGLCRFSYPAIGGFQVEHETLEERIAFLYADERLEERFRFFECFTLPSLRGQLDDDFTFLIVIGDSLPDHHRARLQALTQDMPQVVIQSHPPRKHREVMKEAINSVRRFDGEPCLQFRLDDDDAVGVRFVARLRQAGLQFQALSSEHSCVAIDFNTGVIARPHAKGIELEDVIRQYWTSALGMMIAPKAKISIMNFGHSNVWKFMPTITFNDEDMLLRGHNDYNDSRQKKNVAQPMLEQLDEAGEERLRGSYNISADHVRRVFGKD